MPFHQNPSVAAINHYHKHLKLSNSDIHNTLVFSLLKSKDESENPLDLYKLYKADLLRQLNRCANHSKLTLFIRGNTKLTKKATEAFFKSLTELLMSKQRTIQKVVLKGQVLDHVLESLTCTPALKNASFNAFNLSSTHIHQLYIYCSSNNKRLHILPQIIGNPKKVTIPARAPVVTKETIEVLETENVPNETLLTFPDLSSDNMAPVLPDQQYTIEPHQEYRTLQNAFKDSYHEPDGAVSTYMRPKSPLSPFNFFAREDLSFSAEAAAFLVDEEDADMKNAAETPTPIR
ncbi:MAG: hypothetical protein P4M12_11795 [Gammaproteobacteria bacterium]|nr:hypothetical protein [Gammaproteobacteria bacterium]